MAGPGRSRKTVSAAFCVVLLLSACAPAAGPRMGTPGASPAISGSVPASPAPAGSATASGSAAPSGSATPSGGPPWKTFETSDGLFLFDYPPDWTVRDRAAEAAPGGVFVEVVSAAGKSMAVLRTNIEPQEDCSEKGPYSLMDSQELPALALGGVTPRFVFEGRADPQAGYSPPDPPSYGITSAPLPTGPSACPVFQFFPSRPAKASFSGVYRPPTVTSSGMRNMDTPEAYTATIEYQLIRLTITSLRPQT